jgi:hypothetical protein
MCQSHQAARSREEFLSTPPFDLRTELILREPEAHPVSPFREVFDKEIALMSKHDPFDERETPTRTSRLSVLNSTSAH